MPRRPPSDERLIQKVVRLGHLMDAYGPLLTEKQRRFMQLHYEHDLSFGEIADEFGVSRQAIHDAVKHAERGLEDYESKLGLVAKARRRGEAKSEAAGEAAAILEATLKKLRSAGVIYNSDWIQGDLRRVLETLSAREAEVEVEAEETA